MTEFHRMFPPPWIDERAQIAALLGLLGALEGRFDATMMIDVDLAKAEARAILQTLKNRRRNQRYPWELLAT
jgi:hypothetical protein